MHPPRPSKSPFLQKASLSSLTELMPHSLCSLNALCSSAITARALTNYLKTQWFETTMITSYLPGLRVRNWGHGLSLPHDVWGLSWKTGSLEGWSHLLAGLRVEDSFSRWVMPMADELVLALGRGLISSPCGPLGRLFGWRRDRAAGFPQHRWSKRQQGGNAESFMTQPQRSHSSAPSHSVCQK